MNLYPEAYFQNRSAEQVNTNIPEESIPLSLKAQELTLEESKTYMRWYSDILARTNSRTISMNDVFNFLNNFKLTISIKDQIKQIFRKIINSINIGEFFALLRLISHTLQGQEPSRKLLKIEAPVPQPPSILSKKRINEDEGEEIKEDKTPLDIDSFASFLLTGERPSEKRKKLKSVKFSDQIDVHDANSLTPAESPQPIDYSLPMDQLLERMKKQQPDEEEQEILKDMEPQINHFHNLNNVDTMSVNGVPKNFLQPNMTGPNQMSRLTPNMTGPSQMSTFFSPSPEPLRPNATGPADMARIFAPDNTDTPKVTLSAFSSQMTGPTHENTLQNSKPPVPRHRSVSTPIPNKTPPPPPPPRRRNIASPPPLPPKIYPTNNNDSTTNILDDLRALQEEVDKITSMTNGF